MNLRNLRMDFETFEPAIRLLFDYRGEIGRLEFLLAELTRGVGLLVCYGLFHHGWIVPAAVLVPAAVWPGVVATIKRLRDLGHDPGLVLPVLMYLSAGFAAGYQYDRPAVGALALGSYLAYVAGVKGQQME